MNFVRYDYTLESRENYRNLHNNELSYRLTTLSDVRQHLTPTLAPNIPSHFHNTLDSCFHFIHSRTRECESQYSTIVTTRIHRNLIIVHGVRTCTRLNSRTNPTRSLCSIAWAKNLFCQPINMFINTPNIQSLIVVTANERLVRRVSLQLIIFCSL